MRIPGFVVLTAVVVGGVAAFAQPVITKQPVDQSVSVGANVMFQLSATTKAAPILYQWRLGGTNLDGQTHAALTLKAVQLTNAGLYDAVFTDGTGSVTSRVARLEVDGTFEKITTGVIVTRAGSSRGCAWGDYDEDGLIDLYVSNSAADGNTDGRDFLFHNNGDGTFTERRAAALVQDPIDSQGCVWMDYDNDGHLDLFVSAYFQGSNKNALFRNNGNGTFTKVAADKLPIDGGTCTAAPWADVNLDGFVDFAVANSMFRDSPIEDLFYLNLGNGGFQKVTNEVVMERRYGRGMVWRDYDGDGLPDLFVAVSALNATNRLYHNEGNGVFSLATEAGTGEVTSFSFSGSWGDYDNDGLPDLFVANGGWEAVLGSVLYHNEGGGRFSKITDSAVATNRFGSIYGAWADYDNDGFIDLFVSQSSLATDGYSPTVKNSLYHNNGDGTFSAITAGSMVNDLGCSLGCAWGDYDNDGFLDLFVTNFGSRVNDLFHNNGRRNGNTNSWLSVRCVGTVSNRAAIGAKVRVKATIRGKTMWQLREVSGGGGYTSQSDLRAHFGLGDATKADLVRIEWPSGTVQEFPDLSPKQMLTVYEPPRFSAAISNGVPQFTLKGGRGFQYKIEEAHFLPGPFNWNDLGTLTITNLDGTVPIYDTLAGGATRFFEAYQVAP
jgi:hypothetical protein